MIIVLNDGKTKLDKENFLSIIHYIKDGSPYQVIPIQFEDVNSLQSDPDNLFFIDKFRAVDRDGLVPIYLNHDCNTYITDDWVATLNKLKDKYKNIHINIMLNTDSSIDNVRNLLKETNLAYITNFYFTIDKNDFDLSRCIHTMREYTANNVLILTADHTKKLDYAKIANKICTFTEKRKQNIIALDFGCGFPLCMFENAQIGELFKSPLVGFKFFCSPELVLYPNEDVGYCRMSEDRLNIKNTTSFKDLLDQLIIMHEDKDNCLNNECTTCWYKNRLCSGGCPERSA